MIDEQQLETIFADCLFDQAEVREDGTAPEDAVCVRGIANAYGLHPARLESHRPEVAAMLDQLPREFMMTGGGGWSFLNACTTRDGEQWTHLHRAMEQLFVLGIGLGMAAYLLPGGMPYVVVDDGKVAEALTATVG